MSTGHNDNHFRAAELHDLAAHQHHVGEQHGQQDHLNAQEQSRLALEHSHAAHKQTQRTVAAHGISTFSHTDIATRAHEIWERSGCPAGTAEQDWHQAAQDLRARAYTPKDSV